jgi:two-component system, response regulator YesN
VIRSGPGRLLIVEDDKTTLSGWVELLGDAGYHVTGVSSYEQALDELSLMPDLLITDVRLGVYNGLQLIVRGRMANPDLRAIVVTGYADQVVFREAAHLHAEHVEKPVDIDRLMLLVAKALDPPAKRRAG